MSDFKKKGEKTKFNFFSPECIAAKCWAPGFFQHRAPMMGGGSRNTGSPDTPCCMNRAYHGCPREIVIDRLLAQQRKLEGWRLCK